jgi:hypothetical protein
MKGCGVGRKAVRALATALLAGFVFSGNAVAQVTDQEAKRQIEETYDVEVLRVREGEIDGRGVWLVTVMLPPGDFNTAFMVSNLAIDRQTGDLVLRPAGRPAQRQSRTATGRRAQPTLAITSIPRPFSRPRYLNRTGQPRAPGRGLRRRPGIAAC